MTLHINYLDLVSANRRFNQIRFLDKDVRCGWVVSMQDSYIVINITFVVEERKNGYGLVQESEATNNIL